MVYVIATVILFLLHIIGISLNKWLKDSKDEDKTFNSILTIVIGCCIVVIQIWLVGHGLIDLGLVWN